jgi:hypothetical protein
MDVEKSRVHDTSLSSSSAYMCITTSVASLPVYLLSNFPLIFWFILFATLFWKLFGGQRDPLLSKLTENDMRLLKFIKLASLLRALEVLLVHTQITFVHLFWRIDFKLVELSRISGYILIIITSMLFIYFEQLIPHFVVSFEQIKCLDLCNKCTNHIRNKYNSRRTRSTIHNHEDDDYENQDIIAYTNLIE